MNQDDPEIMWNSKDVYYVSDSTAILAEDMGKALLCQFHDVAFNEEKIPFVRTPADARKALDHILQQSGGRSPLVFCTIMDRECREILNSAEVDFYDIFGTFLDRLEVSLETRALREPGFSRHSDDIDLVRRVEAIHYSIRHDDGTKTNEYGEAEIILVGVSRSGKTPVSVYLATHMGLKSANFPLTSDHLDRYELPRDLVSNRKKVVGLTCSPQHLHKIREKRYSGSRYASLATCTRELQQAQELFMRHNIKVLHTEGKSIEELAVQATQLLGIAKKRWRKR